MEVEVAAREVMHAFTALGHTLDAKQVALRIITIDRQGIGYRAALSALHMMGMAPSDAEIAKEITELRSKIGRIRSDVRRISSAANHSTED